MLEIGLSARDRRAFENALADYTRTNQRDDAHLVEDQLRKTLSGVNGRSVQNRRPGFRQILSAQKTTRAKIKAELRAEDARQAAFSRGRTRLLIRARRKSRGRVLVTAPPGSDTREAIVIQRLAKAGYLAKTFFFRAWRVNFRATPRRKVIQTRIKLKGGVRVTTRPRPHPSATWRTRIPGSVKMVSRHGLVSKAIRHATADMVHYITRKRTQEFNRRFR